MNLNTIIIEFHTLRKYFGWRESPVVIWTVIAGISLRIFKNMEIGVEI
jgi:hypothetical protein